MLQRYLTSFPFLRATMLCIRRIWGRPRPLLTTNPFCLNTKKQLLVIIGKVLNKTNASSLYGHYKNTASTYTQSIKSLPSGRNLVYPYLSSLNVFFPQNAASLHHTRVRRKKSRKLAYITCHIAIVSYSLIGYYRKWKWLNVSMGFINIEPMKSINKSLR